MNTNMLILEFPEILFDVVIDSNLMPLKPTKLSSEFHNFCKQVLDHLISKRDIVKVYSKKDKERDSSLEVPRYIPPNSTSPWISFYIPFKIIRNGRIVAYSKKILIRVSDHRSSYYNEDIEDFAANSIIPQKYKEKIYREALEIAKRDIDSYIANFIDVHSSHNIYISNRIISTQSRPGENIPNATVMAKALDRFIGVENQIKGLKAKGWEKRGNGSTVFTDKINFDFAKYGDKLRINFIKLEEPNGIKKYHETKKETVSEIFLL